MISPSRWTTVRDRKNPTLVVFGHALSGMAIVDVGDKPNAERTSAAIWPLQDFRACWTLEEGSSVSMSSKVLMSVKKLGVVLYQLLAVVIGFYATAWIVFDFWISSINDLAYKFGALEGSRGEMWGEVSDPVRISTILAGLTGGLAALLIVRSLMGINQGRKSPMVKLLVAVTVLLGLATCLIMMFVIGVAY